MGNLDANTALLLNQNGSAQNKSVPLKNGALEVDGSAFSYVLQK